MPALPDRVRRAAERAVTTVPNQVVDVLPGGVGQRVKTIRRREQERSYLPPEDLPVLDNVAYNRSVWDWYADKWTDLEFRQRQLAYEGRADEDPATVERLGEEWGRLDDARAVIDEWVLPHVTDTSAVGEIGTGGGRIARMVAPKVGRFTAFDISPKMLALVRKELADVPSASFRALPEPRFPADLDGTFDFLYSFDVFVHLDLHVQWRYVQAIAQALKPGGRAFLHTANLTTDAGWDRFAGQDSYRVEGFYFMTPEAVRTLAHRAGLDVIEQRSGPGDTGAGNFYYERDFCVLLQKPAAG